MKHMMSMAKGLSSAHFPISAVAISPRVYEAVQRFNQKGGNFGDGFTNSGHPVGIAIVEQVVETGQAFAAALRETERQIAAAKAA